MSKDPYTTVLVPARDMDSLLKVKSGSTMYTQEEQGQSPKGPILEAVRMARRALE